LSEMALNSGAYDPEALSPHERQLLTPESLETLLDNAMGMRTLTRSSSVLVAGQEFGIFEYLVSTLQIEACIAAAEVRPVLDWIAPSADASGSIHCIGLASSQVLTRMKELNF